MPILASHDTDGDGERRERPVKVDTAEIDALASAQVGEDDAASEGVGENDEEENTQERDGAYDSAHHCDGQILHETLCGSGDMGR